MRYSETYVSDLEDTLSQVAKAIGASPENPEALIRRAKYMAASAAAIFNSIDDEALHRAFERSRSRDAGVTNRKFPRAADGTYESGLLRCAWEGFRETVNRALTMLGDVNLPEDRAVQCMLGLCDVLNVDGPYVKATTPYDMLTAILQELSK